MKRQVVSWLALLAVVVAVTIWMLGHGGGEASATHKGVSEQRSGAPIGTLKPRVDPRTQARASISGTIRDEAMLPIAQAIVCADTISEQLPDALTRDPICARTDARGRYKLVNLLAAEYVIHAAAAQFRPAAYHPVPGSEKLELLLAAGANRAGVDLVLRRGGVEVTGVVLDVTGGPVAHAQVRASPSRRAPPGPAVESDEAGRFSLWVDRGTLWVMASADGYAPNRVLGRAPGTFEILLTPESSLAGTVVDATTSQPVEGARVEVESTTWNGNHSGIDVTDSQGRFHVEHLTPGRFTAAAITEHGYGRGEGSTLIGLGQHVDGVIIKLFPARRIVGKIVISSTHEVCPDGSVGLTDTVRDRHLAMRREHDGQYVAQGVLPGTYAVAVDCRGYQARTDYDPIAVSDADISGLTWEVDAGSRLRGNLVTRSGEPVEGARVRAEYIGSGAGDRVSLTSDISKPGGRFELAGLRAGPYRVGVETEQGIAPRDGYAVEIPAAATIERNFVIDNGGKLIGTVIDSAGKPVADLEIIALSADRSRSSRANSVLSDENGAFTIESLRPGEYRVIASRGGGAPLPKPGSTDDAQQGEKALVRSAQTVTVKLVVEAQSGIIKGTVVDAAGNPVSDAFVSSSRESDAAGAQRSNVAGTRDDWWGSSAKPVVTSTDGSFTLTRLSPGTYTLRAYRKGGGEAIAEHVALGSVNRLQIKPTASIEGTVRRQGGGPPQELRVALHDLRTGFERNETFYMTNGHFAVHDLPAGHFEVTAAGDDSQKTITVDLQESAAKTGIEIMLDPLVTLAGRLVEYGTQNPIAGMYVLAGLARGGASFVVDLDIAELSDEAGRFSIRQVPTGQVGIRVLPKDSQVSDYPSSYFIRTVNGSGTVDVGDVGVLKRRVKRGEPVGELGLRFVEPPDEAPMDQREYKISWIDPTGPAAKTTLQVGDVIVSCAGIDVTGTNSTRWSVLTAAAPGTRLVLGTARGTTVTLVLAAP